MFAIFDEKNSNGHVGVYQSDVFAREQMIKSLPLAIKKLNGTSLKIAIAMDTII